MTLVSNQLHRAAAILAAGLLLLAPASHAFGVDNRAVRVGLNMMGIGAGAVVVGLLGIASQLEVLGVAGAVLTTVGGLALLVGLVVLIVGLIVGSARVADLESPALEPA